MPPKVKATREEIVRAAIEIVRECGADSLNARSVAHKLGVSTQPIFSNYSGMDELRSEVAHYAEELYNEYIKREMESRKYPPYKASGMAYICFARDESELFKLLFMCDGKDALVGDESESVRYVIGLIQKASGFNTDRAKLFHLEMWAFVHGIASMMATGYLELDEDIVSVMVSDVYNGLIKRFSEGTDK